MPTTKHERAQRMMGELEASVTRYELDGDKAAFDARQRAIWDRIAAIGTTDAVLDLWREANPFSGGPFAAMGFGASSGEERFGCGAGAMGAAHGRIGTTDPRSFHPEADVEVWASGHSNDEDGMAAFVCLRVGAIGEPGAVYVYLTTKQADALRKSIACALREAGAARRRLPRPIVRTGFGSGKGALGTSHVVLVDAEAGAGAPERYLNLRAPRTADWLDGDPLLVLAEDEARAAGDARDDLVRRLGYLRRTIEEALLCLADERCVRMGVAGGVYVNRVYSNGLVRDAGSEIDMAVAALHHHARAAFEAVRLAEARERGRKCPDCNGAGTVPAVVGDYDKCPTCRGSGTRS